MKALDHLAKVILFTAIFLVIVCSMAGCSKLARIGDTYNGASPEDIEGDARESEAEMNGKPVSKKKKPVNAEGEVTAADNAGDSAVPAADNSLVVNVKNFFAGMGRANNPRIKKAAAPVVELPAPELENVNKYARALEEKLQRRYNNTPGYAGNIAKVQLLPVNKPEASMDGKKLRMSWSQVVYDIWGKRVSDLEKEYYVVTFGDGKPLMQRTRPTITVGLNNEGGYSEFDGVRGGRLSGLELKSGPDMFDRPDSEKTGLLDDNLKSKDSAAAPYLEYELPEARNFNPPSGVDAPVIPPATQPLQAMVVLEEM